MKEAIKELKKSCELKNDSTSAHNNLGLTYFESGDYEEAISEFSKAIQVDPHPNHYNNRG